MRKFWMFGVVGAVLVAAGAAHAAGGTAANGAQVFQRCAMCHSAVRGDGNRIGPNLFGIVGRQVGTAPNFSYSPAMKKAGFVWTDGKLNQYLKSPATVVPGNKMMFAGLASDTQRADVIAYLDTLR